MLRLEYQTGVGILLKKGNIVLKKKNQIYIWTINTKVVILHRKSERDLNYGLKTKGLRNLSYSEE